MYANAISSQKKAKEIDGIYFCSLACLTREEKNLLILQADHQIFVIIPRMNRVSQLNISLNMNMF